MKRENLLSKAYTSSPMILKGVEIIYSPAASEILRELETACFSKNPPGDQTDYHGFSEAIFIMWLLATENKSEVARIRKLPRAERHREVLDFYLENEEEMETLRPELLARMESAMAAAVESETPGKSRPPLPASSP